MFKVIAVITACLVVLVLGVVAVRAVNLHRYASAQGPAEFSSPWDLSSYPTQLPGISVEHVEGRYLNGFHLRPDNVHHKGSVVTFGGSEGSPDFSQAQKFAEQGYDTWALFFWGMPNQAAELDRVPLEFFNEALERIKAEGPQGPLTVMGTSKGAELAAELAVAYPQDIDNLILKAPSAYTFQSLTEKFDNTSSWMHNNQEVPWINLRQSSRGAALSMMAHQLLGFPTSFREVFTTAEQNADNREQARIRVEDFPGRILTIAGEDDAVWDSARYAREIAEHHPDTSLAIYPNAGHVFAPFTYENMGSMVMATGGTKEDNMAAAKASQERINQALEDWHPTLDRHEP